VLVCFITYHNILKLLPVNFTRVVVVTSGEKLVHDGARGRITSCGASILGQVEVNEQNSSIELGSIDRPRAFGVTDLEDVLAELLESTSAGDKVAG